MLDPYIDAIQKHINECVEDLNSIHDLLKQRSWTRVERKAAERLLQILVEACVGISKHWLKRQKKVLPSDAYSVFEKLTEMGLIPHNDSEKWKRIVGLRNAIVHDYLNLDEAVIKEVVQNKMYLELQTFALDMSERLVRNRS